MANEGGLLTVKELSRLLRLSCRQCYKLVNAGKLPKPIRIGRSTRWRSDDIAAFLARGGMDAEPTGRP